MNHNIPGRIPEGQWGPASITDAVLGRTDVRIPTQNKKELETV